VRPASSATTRITIADTVRQVIRARIARVESAMWQASHAAVSSKAVVNRDPCRAHATAATVTPCSVQATRGASASRYTRVAPRSRPRQRRRPAPRS
jgi:hypothetical protein